MDFLRIFSSSMSRKQVDEVVLYVYENPTCFETIFGLMEHKEQPISWRAAWVCEKISENTPGWFDAYKKDRLFQLVIHTQHSGLQRIVLSTLCNLQPLHPIPVPFLDECFVWMSSSSTSVAVKALSLKLLCGFCLQEPSLSIELRAYLDNLDSLDSSPALVSARKSAIKLLNKKHDS